MKTTRIMGVPDVVVKATNEGEPVDALCGPRGMLDNEMVGVWPKTQTVFKSPLRRLVGVNCG